MNSEPLVLVVDDDVDSRALLALALSESGYTVDTAANGLDALRAARRRRPRVILLDLAMPVMDGFTFRNEQLQDDALKAIPVICVSGRHDALPAARKMRIAGCIPKPFDLDLVISSVRKIVGAREV